MKDNELYNSYVAYELLYETNMSKKYKNVSLFPSNWYGIIDYQFKIDVLLEALDKNILIIETKKYNE